MSIKKSNIVIIGDGIAGYTVASRIHSLAPRTKVTLIGLEKVPLYSACALPDYLHGYQAREGIFVPELPGIDKIKLLKGTVVESIDVKQQKVKAGQQWIDYDKLILATGSSALVPPVPGAKIPGNFTLKSLADVEKIMAWGGRSAVVVGSGAIGVETSMALKERGLDVTLIEMVDRIMPTAFDLQASRILQAAVEKHGVKVLVNEKVMGVEGTDQVTGVTTTQGTIPSDLVIWAAGVRSNTVIAQEAGIKTGSLRGIKVDERMQTSEPNVYACGDCVQIWDRLLQKPTLSLLWASAKEQAEVAASSCLGFERVYQGALGVMIEEIGGVTAVSAGFTETSLKDADNLVVCERNNSNGYYKVIYTEEKILGVQFVGYYRGAGAVIAWMKNGVSPRQIQDVLNHESLFKGAPWYHQAERLFSTH
ncbi:NAD(P)/FAD-dependent oxidoreductase [Desulfitobacterium sp.]|uniref:NAD(P)/FAD-dependent oxidoreductase n=1 Tax=Desulfitobacterium sp. TaxID=49981 RepID=UPI002B216B25|nr:FAD-dependent oxidoreductase [Desulfitobacterium sp.]MEA4901578.1 FAD-dependent oxidoreductase [Desulfitobacterium sp.]